VAAPATPPPVASRAVTPAAPCGPGPHFVQVGAFAESDTMQAAMDTVRELQPVRVEPSFVGDRAVARLRLGPVAGGAEAQALLRQVQARGHPGAFLTSAGGAGRASC
jgi:cell division septation protein DedD